jgi:hypothetical protein
MANENDAASGANPAAREEVLGGSVAGGEMISEKLYSPLVFYLHDPREEEESGEYGIYYLYDDRYQITHNEARKHIDAIELTLRRECDDLDKIHGLAEYLPDELPCSRRSQKPRFQFLCPDAGQTPEWFEAMALVSLGGCSTPVCGESPSAAAESFLSQVLERDAPAKYSLSRKACEGILRRAAKRGKELPPMLREALEAQCRAA